MSNNLALIIQGPFNKKAYLHYSKFTNVTIVFSTWVDEVIGLEINSKNHYIVKSDKPITSGPHNLNFQIESSIEGVRKIIDLEKELKVNFFCIKIRSDFIFKNFIELSNISLIKNTIYTTSFYSSTSKTYFTDYIFGGNSDSLFRFLHIDSDLFKFDDFEIPERILYSNWNGNISVLPYIKSKSLKLSWLKYNVSPGVREIKLIQPLDGSTNKSLKRIILYVINKIIRKLFF